MQTIDTANYYRVADLREIHRVPANPLVEKVNMGYLDT